MRISRLHLHKPAIRFKSRIVAISHIDKLLDQMLIKILSNFDSSDDNYCF